MHLPSATAYRLAAALALTTAFVIVWLNVAAGLLGIEDDDPANLMYVGVLAVGVIGAFIARFEPRGLSRALFAVALAQVAVGVFAFQYPNTASPAQVAILHVAFVAMFAAASWLFRYAAKEGRLRP